MSALLWLIPIALILGISALFAFIWALKAGQFDDPRGDGYRVLESEDYPLLDPEEHSSSASREHSA